MFVLIFRDFFVCFFLFSTTKKLSFSSSCISVHFLFNNNNNNNNNELCSYTDLLVLTVRSIEIADSIADSTSNRF